MYLRALRLKADLTQRQLAQRCRPRVAQNTISKLERDGRIRPSHTTVVAIAKALDVEPASLRFGIDPHSKAARTRQLDARRGPRQKRSAPATRAERPRTPPSAAPGLTTPATEPGL